MYDKTQKFFFIKSRINSQDTFTSLVLLYWIKWMSIKSFLHQSITWTVKNTHSHLSIHKFKYPSRRKVSINQSEKCSNVKAGCQSFIYSVTIVHQTVWDDNGREKENKGRTWYFFCVIKCVLWLNLCSLEIIFWMSILQIFTKVFKDVNAMLN